MRYKATNDFLWAKQIYIDCLLRQVSFNCFCVLYSSSFPALHLVQFCIQEIVNRTTIYGNSDRCRILGEGIQGYSAAGGYPLIYEGMAHQGLNRSTIRQQISGYPPPACYRATKAYSGAVVG